MKLLVAGGAGYVGSALVPKLLERGHEVTVIDLLWFGNHLPPHTRVVEKNVLDLGVEDVEGYDQVLFLAGLSNDPMAEFSPRLNFVYNAAAPAFLAFRAKQAGVRRFVHAGSCSVYGFTDALSTEDQPAVPSRPYGISKLQGEHGCLLQCDDTFSVISLRKGTICGYSPRLRLDLVINTMVKTALIKGKIVVNNPAIWRPILAVEDMTAAYLRAVEVEPEVSGVFNIASGNFQIEELAQRVRPVVEKAVGRTIPVEVLDVQECRNYRVSTEQAAQTLGFEPRHNVESITEGLLEHLGRGQDLEDSRYYNLPTFRRVFERLLVGEEIAV